MNLNYPVIEICESTEPNYNQLVLTAIAYTSSKIFQPELRLKNFFGDRELLASVVLVSPQRRMGKPPKKDFLCCRRLHPL